MTEHERLRRKHQSETDLARNASMTLDEWCTHRRISRAMFYKLSKLGQAPQTYWVGAKRFVSSEADHAWLQQRETQAEAVA